MVYPSAPQRTARTESTRISLRSCASVRSMLGHEIRNPLSAITYALEVWPNPNEDPQFEQRVLQIMRRQVKQLTRLCNDLLDAGQSSRGSPSIQRESMDI
ncbi:histidine kinase dimerization/phospho-acceptor domain-containing protein [Pirellulaceae bacterium SH501]